MVIKLHFHYDSGACRRMENGVESELCIVAGLYFLFSPFRILHVCSSLLMAVFYPNCIVYPYFQHSFASWLVILYQTDFRLSSLDSLNALPTFDTRNMCK